MPPPNFPNSPTKIKHVRAQLVALLIMEDVGCTLMYANVANPNIIKVATKPTFMSHSPK